MGRGSATDEVGLKYPDDFIWSNDSSGNASEWRVRPTPRYHNADRSLCAVTVGSLPRWADSVGKPWLRLGVAIDTFVGCVEVAESPNASVLSSWPRVCSVAESRLSPLPMPRQALLTPALKPPMHRRKALRSSCCRARWQCLPLSSVLAEFSRALTPARLPSEVEPSNLLGSEAVCWVAASAIRNVGLDGGEPVTRR